MATELNNIRDHNALNDDTNKRNVASIPITEAQDVDNALQCRICLAGASIENLTVSPCRCSGTMGHLHKSCLDQWLTARDHHLCEICLHPLGSPRPSERAFSQTPLVPRPQLLPVGTAIQPLDPMGMTMDIVAMLVMALGFMYVGYALMQQSPDPVLIGKESTRHANTASKESRRPTISQREGQQQSKDTNREHANTRSGIEVTIFCAVALFLILLSTCGNVAVQFLRVPRPRRNRGAVPDQGGFTLAPESGRVV